MQLILMNTLQEHHKKLQLCTTRPKYRNGRKLRAVKVYTINQESKYLLVTGIPKLQNSTEDLISHFLVYGNVVDSNIVNEYPCEDFTLTLMIKYERIVSSRIGKRYMDDYNYMGGCLHVCYAPEYESLDETKEKLTFRKYAIEKRIKQLKDNKQTIESTSVEILTKKNRKPSKNIVQAPTYSNKNVYKTNVRKLYQNDAEASEIMTNNNAGHLIAKKTNLISNDQYRDQKDDYSHVNSSNIQDISFNRLCDLTPLDLQNINFNLPPNLFNPSINFNLLPPNIICPIINFNLPPNLITTINHNHGNYASTHPHRLGGPTDYLNFKKDSLFKEIKKSNGTEHTLDNNFKNDISCVDTLKDGELIIRPAPRFDSKLRLVPRQIKKFKILIKI